MLVHQYSDVNQQLAYRDKHSAQCSRMDDMSIKLLSCIVIKMIRNVWLNYTYWVDVIEAKVPWEFPS